MKRQNQLQNANHRKDVQTFAACQCGSTLLQERKLTRTVVETWAGKLVPHHEMTVWQCLKCDKPVISHTPRSAIEESILREFIGDDTDLKELTYKTVEIDVNTLSERSKKFIRRGGVGSGTVSGDKASLPEIDRNTPLVTPAGDDEDE